MAAEMVSPVFDLRRLRYFRTIAAHGSLSAAARTLNVSQPALTHHMRELELALGVPIFERSTRGITLTEGGRLLLERATIILDEVASAELELRRFVRGKPDQKTITIAMTPSLAVTLAPYLMAMVSYELPDFVLRIASETGNECRALVARGERDFGIVFAEPNGSHGVPLNWQRLLLVKSARRGAKGTGPPISFAEMAREPLILPAIGSELRQILEEVAAPAGVKLNVVAEMHGGVPRKQAVIAKCGSTILPWQLISAECQAGILWARPVVDPPLKRLIVQESRPGVDPVVAKLINELARKAVDRVLAL